MGVFSSYNRDKSGRPVLQMHYNTLEIAAEALTAVALIACIVLLIMYYGDLPDSIPSHFGLSGEVDEFSGKSSLFLMLGLNIFLAIALTLVSFKPHNFNFQVVITKENAQAQYTMARRMIIITKMFIAWLFFSLQLQTINIALGKASGIGRSTWFILICLIGCSIFMVIYSKNHQ